MTIVDSKTLADQTVKFHEDRHNNPDLHRGYRMPLPWFMDKTGGWGKGWLCFIMGQGGIGKSSVLTTAVATMGLDGVRCLYITLEESLFSTSVRVWTILEDLSRTKFRDIKLTPTDWPHVYEAASKMSKFGVYWADDLYDEASITQAVKHIEPQVVLIDYLQLLTFSGKNITESTSAAVKYLARLRKGNVVKGVAPTVIVAGQLNDDDKALFSRDPNRDGDLVMHLEGIPDGTGDWVTDRRVLRIVKFREGEPGRSTVAFFGGRSLIGELAPLNLNVGPIPKP